MADFTELNSLITGFFQIISNVLSLFIDLRLNVILILSVIIPLLAMLVCFCNWDFLTQYFKKKK